MTNLFDEWSSLNNVMCDWRSRFDTLRKKLPKCKTRKEAELLLKQQGFFDRFPLLPDEEFFKVKPMTNQNLTAKELGKRLGVSGAAIRGYIRDGKLPAYKENDDRLAPWLITPEDAAEFEKWYSKKKIYGDNWGFANPDHPMHGGVKNPDHPLYKPGMESDEAKRQAAVRLTVSQIEWFNNHPEINRNQFIIDLLDKAIEELGDG